MRLYIEFIKNAFQVSITYRMEVFSNIFGSIITLFIMVSIWIALYGGAAASSPTSSGITLHDMITYSIISTCISVIASNNIIWKVEQKVKSGEIAMDMIKPMNFKGLMLCDTLGNNFFRIIFELVPVLIIGSLFFGISLPTWHNFFLFLVALLNGMVIYFLISYISALFVFWYIVAWHIGAFMRTMIFLMSGAFVPLWFFPRFLNTISMFLPFRLIYFTPISIYLEKTGGLGAFSIILQQLLWIGALFIVERIVWHRAIRKLVVQGG